jgi:hypothetical protein
MITAVKSKSSTVRSPPVARCAEPIGTPVSPLPSPVHVVSYVCHTTKVLFSRARSHYVTMSCLASAPYQRCVYASVKIMIESLRRVHMLGVAAALSRRQAQGSTARNPSKT